MDIMGLLYNPLRRASLLSTDVYYSPITCSNLAWLEGKMGITSSNPDASWQPLGLFWVNGVFRYCKLTKVPTLLFVSQFNLVSQNKYNHLGDHWVNIRLITSSFIKVYLKKTHRVQKNILLFQIHFSPIWQIYLQLSVITYYVHLLIHTKYYFKTHGLRFAWT